MSQQDFDNSVAAMELIAEYEASGGAEGRNIDFVPITAEKLGTNDIDRDYGLETSNSGSRLKPLELANLIYRLHTQRGQSLEAIADGLGKSLVVIKNHLAMRAMPEPVKEQVREGAISATQAAKLVKNLPAGTDPNEAAKIIAANKEENARIRGKDKSHKVTAKTLARDKPKPAPKSDPKPEPAKAEAPAPIMAPNAEVEPESKFRSDMMTHEIATDIGLPPEVSAPQRFHDEWAKRQAPHEAHPQLQTAAARENGSQGERVVTLPPPAPAPVVHHPNMQSLVSSEIQKVLGELASIAEDNALNERDPSETIPVSVSLIARADRLYRQIIGDTVTEAA